MTWRGRSVLVTGATGFVGARVAARLVDEGARVTALVRDPGAADELRRRSIALVAGDLAAADVLDAACRGNEVVLHCAARSGDSGSLADFYRDNVEGTLNLARAAVRADCARLVHLSSVSVYGFEPPPVADESTPVGRLGGDYPYAEAKIVAERMLRAFEQPGGTSVVIVRVGSVFGPGSRHWTVRPVRVLRNPRVGLLLVDRGEGLHNYVYIDNLVDGLLLAAGHPAAAGGLFNLTDGAVTYRAFFDFYALMIRGGTGRVRNIDRRAALAVAYAAEQLARWRGRDPLLTRIAVKLLLRRSRFPSARAADVLGFRPAVPLDQGMAACQQWLSGQGLV